jgi:hypothetical protein
VNGPTSPAHLLLQRDVRNDAVAVLAEIPDGIGSSAYGRPYGIERTREGTSTLCWMTSDAGPIRPAMRTHALCLAADPQQAQT